MGPIGEEVDYRFCISLGIKKYTMQGGGGCEEKKMEGGGVKNYIGVCPNGTNTPRGNQFKFFQK